LGIGDWGLGPIPNPQSPIPKNSNDNVNYFTLFYIIIYNQNYYNFLLIQIKNEIRGMKNNYYIRVIIN